MQLKKDELVILSEGEYSEYQILWTFRVVRSFNTGEVLVHYLKEASCYDSDVFVAWLKQQNYVEEIETREWHVSNYGEIIDEVK